MKSFHKNQDGQAMLEFAIVMPVLLLIVIGVIAVAYMLVAQQVVTYAAREGARIGSQTNSNEQILGAIEEAVGAFDSNLDRLTVAIDPEGEYERSRGDTLSIQVLYNLPFSIPIVTERDHQLSVNATSLTRIEYDED